ncbi:unnamed protein product [Linum trigynum]|uniref:RRM domain-containing protein n=1 Tax=Linum trigynum TaxID=586398 RepID=A0AAV2FK52_9ROSI
MSQQRQFHHQMSGHYYSNANDTTLTKLFVGGLAWETQRETMRRYFEQFGEIIEAVVITDKNTGRSKGYGFVTFKDPESAMRACQNPSPVIDGRRANCNLASLGATKTRPSIPSQHGGGGGGRFRGAEAGLVAAAPPTAAAAAFQPSSAAASYIPQPSGQYTFPYSAYGYAAATTGYPQETAAALYHHPMSYYGVYGGHHQQHVSPYYAAAAAGGSAGGAAGGMAFHNFYPFYPAQYAQHSSGGGSSGQVHGFGGGAGVQYTPPAQVVQYTPYFPHQQQHYPSSGILSLPVATTTAASPIATTAAVATTVPSATTVAQAASTTASATSTVTTVAAAARPTTTTAAAAASADQNSSPTK